MSYCSVKWCGKNSKTSGCEKDGISFHKFPDTPEIKEKWIEATQKDNWFPTKYSIICSRHFTPDSFEPLTNKRRRLFSSAVPTQFLPIVNDSLEPQPSTSNTSNTLPSQQTEQKNEDDGLDRALSLSQKSDDAATFGDFVAAAIRNMKSDARKRELKRKIQRIILEIEELDEHDHNSLSSTSSDSSDCSIPQTSMPNATWESTEGDQDTKLTYNFVIVDD